MDGDGEDGDTAGEEDWDTAGIGGGEGRREQRSGRPAPGVGVRVRVRLARRRKKSDLFLNSKRRGVAPTSYVIKPDAVQKNPLPL